MPAYDWELCFALYYRVEPAAIDNAQREVQSDAATYVLAVCCACLLAAFCGAALCGWRSS
jgi:hypothetical protein